jgi:hypothetical protein
VFVRDRDKNTMNIYLDIDGTLIHEDGYKAGEPAAGLADFIKALRPHDVYWLTTHCMNGDPEPARALLKGELPEELHGDVDRIKPTKWSMQKTEAIDFSQPFIWFDDAVMDGEEKVLREKAVLDNQWLIRMDLESKPDQIRTIVREYFS